MNASGLPTSTIDIDGVDVHQSGSGSTGFWIEGGAIDLRNAAGHNTQVFMSPIVSARMTNVAVSGPNAVVSANPSSWNPPIPPIVVEGVYAHVPEASSNGFVQVCGNIVASTFIGATIHSDMCAVQLRDVLIVPRDGVAPCEPAADGTITAVGGTNVSTGSAEGCGFDAAAGDLANSAMTFAPATFRGMPVRAPARGEAIGMADAAACVHGAAGPLPVTLPGTPTGCTPGAVRATSTPAADLRVQLHLGAPSIEMSASTVATPLVSNHGPSIARGVVVDIAVPPGISIASMPADCVPTATGARCTQARLRVGDVHGFPLQLTAGTSGGQFTITASASSTSTPNADTVADTTTALLHVVGSDATIDPPTPLADPRVIGDVVVGSSVACTYGRWRDATGEYTFRWLRGAVTIPGANSQTLAITAGMLGQPITCLVTASNAGGSTVAVSAPTEPVRRPTDPPIGGGGNENGTPTHIPRAKCTIVGTPGPDRIRGTRGRDVICGLGGNDVIDGLGGNDVIIGGPGNDTIRGGAGNDLVDGGAGHDRIFGDAGNDTLRGFTGNDTIHGGAGSDTIIGGRGNDRITGGAGGDLIVGGDGNDIVDGGMQNDILMGNRGNDTLTGGAGNDLVTGHDGNDTLHGGDGDDMLWGGNGNDTLWGDFGRDFLYGMNGDNTLHVDASDFVNAGPGSNSILHVP